MTSQKSPTDTQVIDRLLTELVRRLGGALDFGTVVALGQFDQTHPFLAKQCETIRSLVIVLRSLLGDNQSANGIGVGAKLERLNGLSQEFIQAMTVLEGFRTCSTEDLRYAAQAVGRSYWDMIAVDQELAQALGCTSLQRWPPDREAHHRQITANLEDVFLQARSAG